MIRFFILVPFLFSTLLFAQKTDSITFYSKALNTNKTILIHTPEFFKYQADSVQLPVIYLLDGQHDWFVNPLLSTIKYLQYTHEIPQAIIVIVPLNNRMAECAIPDLKNEPTPLLQFLTNEIESFLLKYKPNSYRLLIGHSFSASFSLYAMLKKPQFFSTVVAHTPLDRLEELIKEFSKNEKINKKNITISVGGLAKDKDYYHRNEIEGLKKAYPAFFDAISFYIADNTAHNAVPIVTSPIILNNIFADFSSRFASIAKVNENYELIEKPASITAEIKKLQNASKLNGYVYAPEIPEINGLASRYMASEFTSFALAIYEIGKTLYPKNYEFPLALYELYLISDVKKAKEQLKIAATLLNTIDADLPERELILAEIRAEEEKNGW